MATATFSRKSNADMLALIQSYYPAVSDFTWSLLDPNSATVTASGVITDVMKSDIINLIIGSEAWSAS